MKKLLLLPFFFITITVFGQLPGGGQFGCPSIPLQGAFDTTCFQNASELLLGQGYFDHYGGADPVYLVIPQNRPSYAIALAVGWNYYRNTLGHNKMSINQWFATMGQENGFATYNDGVQLPATIFDVEAAANVAIPCTYPRGCNSNSCGGAGYCWHVGQNLTDGPYHNTLAGYQTISPYVPSRYPGPATTYHQLYNSNMEMATMNKTFYDLSIYRRAELMNNVNLGAIESGANDNYGVEAAQALAYNLGPNASNAISSPGYTLPAGIATNTNWASSYYSGGVSCYAQRVAAMTAILDNQEVVGKANYAASGCGSAANWDFYSFYDSQIKWDTVLASINRLLLMYPEINSVPASKAAFISAVQTAFNIKDVDANSFISYRYEMGAVIDAITFNLPKDDPGFNAQYAINGTGCKLNCRAPYTTIKTSGPSTICTGQSIILTADVDAPTSSTIYQWQLNGTNIGGATSSTYTASAAGTYSVIVCWSTFKETDGTAVVCCSQPQCGITVTVTNCNTCGMGLNLTPTANSCTGMANGSILANVTGGPFGTVVYSVTGPAPSLTTSTFTGAVTSNSFTGLRDGKYTIEVYQQSTPTCKAVQDIFIVPTTVIKESVLASYSSGACQLDATIINQQPNTCPIQVSYGALNAFSWARELFMDFKVNGTTSLTLFESYPSAGLRDDPWDFFPFSWPNGGAGNAPNVKTVTVSDGDIITVNGGIIIPQGIAASGWIDGGVRIDGATFTNTGTSVATAFANFRYQAPSPVAGTRQMGATYRVTCPVVSPPVYTFSWSPTSGLSNANIRNPIVSVASTTVYTVTATHPTNTSCQITSSVSVPGPTPCAPLPITWLDFSAVLENMEVKLNWTTINESNCKNYQVIRSTDGVNFESIGSVNCNNKSSLNNYSFADSNPYSGPSYYRIEEIDFDGKSLYSAIEQVGADKWNVSVMPNPFTNQTEIMISGIHGQKIMLRVIDMNGKELYRLNNVNSDKKIAIGENLALGVYILQIINNDEVLNYKIVKD